YLRVRARARPGRSGGTARGRFWGGRGGRGACNGVFFKRKIISAGCFKRKKNKKTAATMTAPPMIFPIVTGNRLPTKKFPQVNSGKSAAVFPMLLQKESGAPALMNSPIGMK